MSKILTQPDSKDLHSDDVMCLAVIDGKIFSGSYDGYIKKWDSQLKLLQTWQAHNGPVYALVGDSERIFTSSSAGEVKEWDVESGNLITSTLLQNPNDGKTGEVKALFLFENLIFAGDDRGVLTVWKPDFEIDSQKFIYVDIWSLAVSPDGRNIFTVRDNECIVSDFSSKFHNEMFATTLAVRTTISGRAPVAVDGGHVVIVDRSGMNINVHKNETTSFPLKFSLQGGHDMIINAILISQEAVVSSGWDSKFVVWDIESGKKTAELQWENYVNAMAWYDQTKKIVIAGGRGGSLVLVQLQ